ncbi:hypothetical protein B0T16DRAFT_213622 [Cercophora newfieldiana]|uniref:Uncharacterized protein n=1 Tax=Cercophora newfieldiana TaxID=92897 RepID=A0AA40CK26_9PEZI|nr:hypothetical protein B0T16DRAFT_213622 [Cercophora newfieldiana]
MIHLVGDETDMHATLSSAAPLDLDTNADVDAVPSAVLTVPGGGAIVPAPTAIITVPGAPVCTAASCYTYTKTITKRTTAVPTNVMCPLLIHITTKDVPCADACCATTKTRTVTKTISGSGCVVPTETVIRTTGCKAGPVIGTPTAILTLAG